MVNPFARVNWSPSPAELRRFALTLTIGAPALALLTLAISYLRTGTVPIAPAVWICAIGGGIAAVSVMSILVGRLLYRVWYAIGCSIGLITANLALMGVFFFVVTPLGLTRRLLGQSRVLRAPSAAHQSYWVETPPSVGPRSYTRQF
jgi:hypothetical protein